METKKYAHKDLLGKPTGKRPLGRPSCRSQDKKMDLKETGWDSIGRGLTKFSKNLEVTLKF
jgi:hypothetical protein